MDKHLQHRALDDESIGALLSRAVSDAETVARAEIALQKARVVAKLGEARNAVVLLLAAVVAGLLALIALVVGALLVLAPLVGPLSATAIVVGTLLVATAVPGWLALRQVKLLFGATEEGR